MPRLPLVVLSVSLGAVCAIVLAACGSDDEDGTIPPASAQALIQSLQDAQGEQSQGDCQGVADAAGNLLTQIDELPDSVDPEVRQALAEGSNNLRALGEDETNCGGTGPTGEEGPETTDTTTSTSTPPPTTTETTTDTTTEEETKPPKPKPPKPKPEPQPEQPGNEGGGLGQGDSGGTPPGLGNEGEGGGD
jgi:hypothetical protein